MCSLVGYIIAKGNLSAAEKTKLIRCLLTEGDTRGGHASGVAYWKGGTAYTFKAPCLGSKLNPDISGDTKCVMGHTRYATVGDCEQNDNNHPFWSKMGYHLAHNGCLYREKQVREKYNLNMHPAVQTDSYLFVQLIDKLGGANAENIKTAMEEITGSKCISILDESGLWLAKDDNPLEIRRVETKGGCVMYVYASTAAILEVALKLSKIKTTSSTKIDIKKGDIIRIPYTGEISVTNFKSNALNGLSYWNRGLYGLNSYDYDYSCDYEDYGDYEDEENVDAIRWLSSFGITREQIHEMFMYGYDYDDIFDAVADGSIWELFGEYEDDACGK